MITRLWAIGVKVHDLDREVKFHLHMGHPIVLDETLIADGDSFRLVLVKMGDKYLNLNERLLYERVLGESRPVGSTHMVYMTDSFEADVARCLAGGAAPVGEVATVSGGFGSRRIAFFKAPGGWFFEIFETIQNLLPEV